MISGIFLNEGILESLGTVLLQSMLLKAITPPPPLLVEGPCKSGNHILPLKVIIPTLGYV